VSNRIEEWRAVEKSSREAILFYGGRGGEGRRGRGKKKRRRLFLWNRGGKKGLRYLDHSIEATP